jgi:signal transduction histidine kinase
MVVFAVAFTLVRAGLWWLGKWIGVFSSLELRSERPGILLPLLIAPLAALPLLSWAQRGDGALLLSSAALLALLFVVREATNLSTARSELEAERDRLARAKALQEELLHLITHEVKNPLTSVLASADLSRHALERKQFEKLPQYVSVIDRGGKAIQRLVDNLLQLSRIEQDTDLPPSTAIDLRELILEVVEELRPLAEQKQQSLVVNIEVATPRASAAPLLLHEAMSNLVSNAVKYTPEHGRICAWARPGERPGTVLLGVTDNGIGLSQEELGRLFTRFFRSVDPRARRERGSGLGLALTRSIVRRMGGDIRVESQLDAGTTFSITLPATSP